MGQNPTPSPEELEFIFSRFADGMTDSSVLDDMGDEGFPRRNPRFLRDRRREFDAAKKVLEINIKAEIDPIIVKAKKAHFAKLTDIATTLLANDVKYVYPNPTDNWSAALSPALPQPDYWIGQPGKEHGLSRAQLKGMLERNWVIIQERYGYVDIENFKAHLDVEMAGITDTYAQIEVIRARVEGKVFKGKCVVCKDW